MTKFGICRTNWFSVMAIWTSSLDPRTRAISTTALRGTMPVVPLRPSPALRTARASR